MERCEIQLAQTLRKSDEGRTWEKEKGEGPIRSKRNEISEYGDSAPQ
jgi:hypothetical protein